MRFSFLFAAAMACSFVAAVPGLAQQPPDDMVLVPAGRFTFGSNANEGLVGGDTGPQQEVDLPAFFVDKTEVTNEDYKAYCDATKYPVPPYWKNGSYPEGQGKVPVTHVNVWEAAAYARWKGKRLPTEIEWEKAARGTDGRTYPWGNNWNKDHTVTEEAGPIPVGSRPAGASPYGALDMAGNVYEWTSSWYGPYPGSNLQVPQYGKNYKVIRGGAFDGMGLIYKSFYRSVTLPSARSSWTGFRCVKDVDSD